MAKKKAAKQAATPATSTPQSAEHEHLARIREAETEVAKYEKTVARYKEAMKEAKTALADAQRTLREEIRDNNMRLDFSGNPMVDGDDGDDDNQDHDE